MISRLVMRHKVKLIVGLIMVLVIGHMASSNGKYFSNSIINLGSDKKIIIDPVSVPQANPEENGADDSDVDIQRPIADKGQSQDGEKQENTENTEDSQVGEDKDAAENKDVGDVKPEVGDVKPEVGDDNQAGSNQAEENQEQVEDNQNESQVEQTIDEAVLSSIRDYKVFFNGMEDYSIKSPSIKDKYTEGKAAEKFSGTTDFLFSKKYLENVLDIPDETFAELKDSHQRYVNNHINKLINEYKLSTFGNILKSDGQWKDYEGSKGYVMIGGGKYSWLSYLVIKQIRATGSTLPIELFIPSSSEYEKKFCDEVLPGYNARCNVFDDDFSAELADKFGIGGYQYKMLAMLSSEFENIIYLDSDNFPVRNPEFILDSALYKEKGLIIWPDAWARTTNPKFYDIANVEVKENKVRYSKYDEANGGKKSLDEYNFENSWYHDFEGTLPDPTSEAGMLIVNKTKHVKTLLLALYYNVFGPNYYYPLMTQGSAGEGDKETFIAAAHVLGEPWFQTLKKFKWCGYHSESEGKFTSKALGHYDPIQSQMDPEGDLDIIFMHLSYPKYYPNWLVDNHDLIYPDLDKHIRMYGGVYKSAGYDFDLRVLQFFTQALCKNYYDSDGKPIDGEDLEEKEEYMGHYLKYVSSDEKNIERCSKVFLPHLKWLKETSEYPKSVVQPKKHDDY